MAKKTKNVDRYTYQIILGSLLGDANLCFTGNKTYFNETHSIKQEKYLLWKKKYLSKYFDLKTNYKIDKRGKKYIELWTRGNQFFTKIYNEIYKDRKKTVTKKILAELKSLGLAVWFMDDGALNLNGGGDLSTDGFTKEENYLIKNYLNNLIINCRVFRRKSGTYKIVFNQEGFKKLVKIIKSHIHPELKYKIDFNRQKEYHQRDYKRNKDKIKIRDEIYYKKNREQILKRKKEYSKRPEVKEKKKKYNRKYYLDNREILLKIPTRSP